MSLTEKDLKQIEGITERVTSKKVDELAVITARGFNEVHKTLNNHSEKLDEIIDRVSHLEFIVANLSTRIENIEQMLSKLSISSNEDIDALYNETNRLKKRINKIELKILALSRK